MTLGGWCSADSWPDGVTPCECNELGQNIWDDVWICWFFMIHVSPFPSSPPHLRPELTLGLCGPRGSGRAVPVCGTQRSPIFNSVQQCGMKMSEFSRLGRGGEHSGEPIGYKMSHSGHVDGIGRERHMDESHGEFAQDYSHCHIRHPVPVLVVGRGRAHFH